MSDDAEKFLACLDEAQDLLKAYPVATQTLANRALTYAPPENFELALFENWTGLDDLVEPQKTTIRIIQHMSCSGGTLISKCIAGLPNVGLLSEVNPRSELHVGRDPKFAPTDLTYLALQSKFPLVHELSEKLFRAEVRIIARHVNSLGMYLVIREHSHSDYLIGPEPGEGSTVRRLLQDEHRLLTVLTVRHPVDSYLSLLNNGWIHFTPKLFDEYCKRYLLFIEHNEDVPIYKYEDFVNDPQHEMKRLCQVLQLPFSEDFQNIFDLNVISGDSGRSSNIIQMRERRDFPENFNEKMKKSDHYFQLCERLGYETSTE